MLNPLVQSSLVYYWKTIAKVKVQGNIYDQYYSETISVCLKFAPNFCCSYTVLGSGKVSAGSISGEKSKQMLLKAGLDPNYQAEPSKIIWWFHLEIGRPSFLRPLSRVSIPHFVKWTKTTFFSERESKIYWVCLNAVFIPFKKDFFLLFILTKVQKLYF